MPLYDFECPSCGVLSEESLPIAERDSERFCGSCRCLKRRLVTGCRTFVPLHMSAANEVNQNSINRYSRFMESPEFRAKLGSGEYGPSTQDDE